MKPLKAILLPLFASGILINTSPVLAAAIDQLPTDVHSGSILLGKGDDATMAAQTKISASKAIEIANEALPGKVIEAKLENERGYLVWEVEIVKASGKEIELMIDAGNGRLLAAVHEKKEDEEDEQKGKRHHWWEFWEDNDQDRHHD